MILFFRDYPNQEGKVVNLSSKNDHESCWSKEGLILTMNTYN